MPERVLVTVTHIYSREAAYLRRLEHAGLEVVRRVGRSGGKLTEDELLDALPGTFAALAGSEPYTARVFARAPQLRVIARWGVGFDAIDVAAATRHGVLVCTADESSEVAMANRAIDAILAVGRGEKPAGDGLINPEALANRGAPV